MSDIVTVHTCVIVILSFIAAKDFAAVYNQVYGIIGGIPVKFPGFPDSQKNACTLGMTCPAKSGATVKETVSLPVSKLDPSVSYITKLSATVQVVIGKAIAQDRHRCHVSCRWHWLSYAVERARCFLSLSTRPHVTAIPSVAGENLAVWRFAL